MKKKPILTAVALAILLILNTACAVSAASYELSPALEIIAENVELKKCTVKAKDIKFSAEDFESAVGKTVEYITVKSLPSPYIGVLKYAGSDVFENQTVSRKNLGLLKFSPSGLTGSASFEFSADGSENLCAVCTLSVLDKENSAPICGSSDVCALSGIGVVKSLNFHDPDGDKVSLEISNYPKKGVVKPTESGFVYTCLGNYEGKDSFSYTVTDEYGNVSDVATVNFTVRKPKTDIRYDDMNGHWGYTSAIKLTEMGLMDGSEADGQYLFNPDAPISRGDFLALALIGAGLEDKMELGAVTTFADDGEIPFNIKSYAAYAMNCGIVSGYKTDDGKSVFESSSEITRAEAANILSGILGEAQGFYELNFTDAASIPGWAKNSFASLVSLGIINGSPNGSLEPQGKLTRAQAAELLCNVMQYSERK